MIAVMAISFAILTGCAHTSDNPRPTYKAVSFVTEEGESGWIVTCGRVPNCYEGVSEKCPNGYDIYKKVKGVTHRGLMVTCK